MQDVIINHATSIKKPTGVKENDLYLNAKKDLQNLKQQQFNQQHHLYRNSQFINFEAKQSNDPFAPPNGGMFLPPNNMVINGGYPLNQPMNPGYNPLLYNPILNNNVIPNMNILVPNQVNPQSPGFGQYGPQAISGYNNINPAFPMMNINPSMNSSFINPNDINILKPLSIPMDPNQQLQDNITKQFLQNKINNHNINTKFNMALHFKNERHKNGSQASEQDLNTLDMQVKHIGTLTPTQLGKCKCGFSLFNKIEYKIINL